MGHSKGKLLGFAVLFAVAAVLSVGSGVAAQSPPAEGERDDLGIIASACEHIVAAARDLAELARKQEFAGQAERARETREEQKALVAILSRYLVRVKGMSSGLTKQAAEIAEKDPAKAKALLKRWARVDSLKGRIETWLTEVKASIPAAPPAAEEDKGNKAEKPAPDIPSAKWAKLGKTRAKVVRGGLEWLRDHQHPDGFWDCDGFMRQDKVPPICDGAGQAIYDPGVTGLALLAFLGVDQTHRHGDFKDTVRKGLQYLGSIQTADGCFGPKTDGHFVYNHAVCTLAMVEAYGATGAPHLKKSAQKAVDFIHKAQNPYLAWRYGIRPQDNDTSVTGWMVSALFAAKRAKLRTFDPSFEGARNWIEKVTNAKTGRVGYTAIDTGPARPEGQVDRWPPEKSESLTAIGILVRMYTGEDPRKSEIIAKGVDRCLKRLPVWDLASGTVDPYYWYYGSLALRKVGGRSWRKWDKALVAAVVDHQRRDPVSFKGSWDPDGPWGASGGRVYSTALCTLILLTPVR
jgi:hypothetical protein